MGRHKTRNKHLPPRMRLIAGRYYWRSSVDGKDVSQPLGDDYVRALLKWREIEGLHDGCETVADLLDAFVARMPSSNAGTLKEYTRASSRLKAAFKGFASMEVLPKHIAQYLRSHDKPVTANREIAVLSRAYSTAINAGRFDGQNPCLGVDRNKEKKRKRVATLEEIALIQKGDGPIPIMCEMAMLTGLRESDLRMLRLDAFNDAGLTVTPRKTSESTNATVEWSWTAALKACFAKAKLLRRRVGSVYLFAGKDGQPLSVNAFQSAWRRHRAKCGCPDLRFHDLRRTAINLAKTEGGTDYARLFAAHGSVATTEGYLKNLQVSRVRPTR